MFIISFLYSLVLAEEGLLHYGVFGRTLVLTWQVLFPVLLGFFMLLLLLLSTVFWSAFRTLRNLEPCSLFSTLDKRVFYLLN